MPSNDHRIRVLWLIKGLGAGGAERLLAHAARHVDKARIDLRVVYLRPDKDRLVEDFRNAGVDPRCLTPGGWRRVAALRRELAATDVVHSHSPVVGSLTRVLSRSMPRRRRPAVLYTEHNEWPSYRVPTRLVNAATAWLDDRHWTVSQRVLDTVWPPLRSGYRVLIHGIDTTAVSAAPGTRQRVRAALDIAPDQVVALTVANLRADKDYPNLLRAAELAIAARPDVTFLAVGQGPLADEVAELHARLGLGERCRLLGFRADVYDLMAAADLLLLASRHEGLPVAIMEAFAAGLPVVATNVGGIPEAVTDGVTGLLVPPEDAGALAQAVLALAGNRELRTRLAGNARRTANRFDIRTSLDVQQAAYQALAGRPAPGSRRAGSLGIRRWRRTASR